MRTDQSLAGESTRDSLESSEISFQSSTRPRHNHFNHITQNIQNNNNKITIIIKHNEGASVQPSFAPQIIYIQPAASQPNLHSTNFNQSHNDLENISEVYNSLDDLDSEEHYQFYDERAVDVPDDFKRNSYLVLNFNDAANAKLKRRICTPTRKLLPPEDSQKIKDFNSRNQTIDNQVSLITSLLIQAEKSLESFGSLLPRAFFSICQLEGSTTENITPTDKIFERKSFFDSSLSMLSMSRVPSSDRVEHKYISDGNWEQSRTEVILCCVINRWREQRDRLTARVSN